MINSNAKSFLAYKNAYTPTKKFEGHFLPAFKQFSIISKETKEESWTSLPRANELPVIFFAKCPQSMNFCLFDPKGQT